jgi:hypothetical protein
MTIRDDIAATLNRLRHERNRSFKDVVNEALDRGLDQMSAKPKRRGLFRTRTVSLGRPMLDNLDNIGEVLALLEGERHR